jgi:hypothetical protein
MLTMKGSLKLMTTLMAIRDIMCNNSMTHPSQKNGGRSLGWSWQSSSFSNLKADAVCTHGSWFQTKLTLTTSSVDYILTKFPEGYKLFAHEKGDNHDIDRRDAYLYSMCFS